MRHPFDRRPILVTLAGPNGAGKTTFYHAHIEPSGLPFLNPDLIAAELGLTPEDAAVATAKLLEALVGERRSFVFETVFSDPVGDRIAFLKNAAKSGYTVILCFIGLAGPLSSEERVAMRVSQGGHDVPSDKLTARYPRIMANLRTAIAELPNVHVFDNEDLRTPFQRIAVFENGRPICLSDRFPKWFRSVWPGRNR
jgi:predicted ABC-type ATPase